MRSSVATGFAPWIIFWVVASPSTWEWAALAALVVSIGVIVPGLARHQGASALDLTGVACFAVLSVLALVLDRAALSGLENYAQTLSMAVLAVVAVGGALVGRPFTAFYARQDVPREYWSSPEFLRINRTISLVWGVAFVVIAAAGFVAVRYGVLADLLQWVIPIVVIIAAARFTEAYTDDDAPAPTAAAAPATTPGRPA